MRGLMLPHQRRHGGDIVVVQVSKLARCLILDVLLLLLLLLQRDSVCGDNKSTNHLELAQIEGWNDRNSIDACHTGVEQSLLW